MQRHPVENYHIPVLPTETLEALDPQPGQVAADLTLGGAGHALKIANALGKDGHLYGIDRDPDALRYAKEVLKDAPCKTSLVQGDFANLVELLPDLKLDLLLADLGVSSHQLDTPERGFSWSDEGPLDMRMEQSGETAADYLLRVKEEHLARALREGGDVPKSRRLARALKRAAEEGEMETTSQLRSLCERVMGRTKKKVHVGTIVFQAIRIAVNQEMHALDSLLIQLPKLMKPGGRVALISFHSGEDRRVKRALRVLEGQCTCPPRLPLCRCGAISWGTSISRKPIIAGEAELQENPRARSAKLRAFHFHPEGPKSLS